MYTGKKPNVAHLRVFGSVAYAKLMPAPPKLESRTVKAVMVGYNGSAGYHLWDPQAQCFFFACDAVFEEGVGHWSCTPAGGDEVEIEAGDAPDLHAPITFAPDATESSPDIDEPYEGGAVPEPESTVTGEPRRSGCMHTPSKAHING
jgi:hypothetical protein